MADEASHVPDARIPPAEEDRAVGPWVHERRRSDSATRDLTEGSIPKNLWFLAWPQVVEGLLSVID